MSLAAAKLGYLLTQKILIISFSFFSKFYVLFAFQILVGDVIQLCLSVRCKQSPHNFRVYSLKQAIWFLDGRCNARIITRDGLSCIRKLPRSFHSSSSGDDDFSELGSPVPKAATSLPKLMTEKPEPYNKVPNWILCHLCFDIFYYHPMWLRFHDYY